MKQIWPEDIGEILKIGKSLFGDGINNWALSKDQALIAIAKLHSIGVPILGGDVYILKDKVFSANYDNWYCDQLPQEEQSVFLNRSIAKARHFIEVYKSQEPEKTFFVLVPDF